MRRLFHLILALLLPLTTFSQRCRFVSEKLDFRIDRTWFNVRGEYTFSNQTSDTINVPIAYPVPSYGMGISPDTLSVMTRLSPPSFLVHRIKDTIVSFSFTIPPKSSKSIWIYYRQKHPKGYARYALSAVARWEQPLDYVKYTLFAGRGIEIHYFSIPWDSKTDPGGGIRYQWERRNYMPNKDFEIRY